jgi:hypothetical protein
MRLLLFLVVALSLSGCALFSKEKLAAKPLVACASPDAAMAKLCNDAVDAVEKANILSASVNTAIDNGYLGKTLTQEQARAYRVKTKQADKVLDEAQDALNDFNFSGALTKANATKLLLDTLNKEIAAQVAKGQK